MATDSKRTLSLFLVDDSTLVRLTLADLVTLVPGVTICGEAESVAEAIAGIATSDPDVIILDLNLPGGSGVDVLQAIKLARPSAVVIILTMHRFRDLGARCLEAGADYYFEKGRDLDALVDLLIALRWQLNQAIVDTDIVQAEMARQKQRTRADLMRHVTERSPECIKFLDRDGRMLWINNAGRSAFDLAHEPIVTPQPWAHFYAEKHRKAAQGALASARKLGVGRFTGFCVTPKGREKWWEVCVTRMDEKNSAARFLVVSRDITERQNAVEKLSEELDRLTRGGRPEKPPCS